MLADPERDSAAIVLLGSLNPAIFQPQWFVRHGLLPAESADNAHIDLIHKEISKFDWDERIFFTVESERLVAEIHRPPFIDLADLLERTFREFLPHTPLVRLGINRHVHFSVGSEEARNEIGKMLAPHEPWGEWGETLEGDKSARSRGGLRGLTMEQNGLTDRPAGHLRVRVEPSLQVADNKGVYIATNDEFRLENSDEISGSIEMMDMIRDNWDKSMHRAEKIFDQIVSLKP